MEEYRRRLQKDIVWYVVILVIFAILAVAAWFSEISLRSGISGGFFGACLNCFFSIRKNKKLLKDGEKLSQEYIRIKDERLDRIGLESARMTLGILFIGLCIAIVIAMFINKIVFLALGGVLIFAIVVFFFVRAVYERVM